MYRVENDSLGQLNVPQEALWGIHTQRALQNFVSSGLPQRSAFYKALAQVKLVAAKVNLKLGYLEKTIGEALVSVLETMVDGKAFESFVVDPMQGGAGTSTNMNINEVAANLATIKLGGNLGQYLVHPLEHVNLHQSTNDVYSTALKIAVYAMLQPLEQELNQLLVVFQEKEKQFQNSLRMGRTELLPAVPYTFGQTFGAYAQVFGRDRWRIFKAMERIRQVNLGGTAIGTGVNAPLDYIFQVSDELRSITGFPIARAENMVDATQNLDQIAEVFSAIKIVALNLEKVSNDLRKMLMLEEIVIPNVQVGSSAMPGKYNPVILEMISSIAKKIIGNEVSASMAIAQGEFELNAFSPLITCVMLESLELLTQGIGILTGDCLQGLTLNDHHIVKQIRMSPVSATLLVKKYGYQKATEVAVFMQKESVDLVKAATEVLQIDPVEVEVLLSIEKLRSLGHD